MILLESWAITFVSIVISHCASSYFPFVHILNKKNNKNIQKQKQKTNIKKNKDKNKTKKQNKAKILPTSEQFQ